MLNGVDEYDIRSDPYDGFMIFSRRYCGSDFTDGIISGQIQLMIMDYEAVYNVKHFYERTDKQRR
jgi:hypothetical protein